jgi:hypothetical protein
MTHIIHKSLRICKKSFDESVPELRAELEVPSEDSDEGVVILMVDKTRPAAYADQFADDNEGAFLARQTAIASLQTTTLAFSEQEFFESGEKSSKTH